MTKKSKPVKDDGLRIEQIKLSTIPGLHSVIETMWQELSIPPLQRVPPDQLGARDIKELAGVFPLRLAKENNRLRCTGNIRLFQYAQVCLDRSTEVPAVVENTIREDVLRQRVLKEILWGPALLGVHYKACHSPQLSHA